MKPVLALLAATLVGVGAAAPARAQNPFASDLSVEQEQEMTAQIHAQIRAQTKFVSDPVLLGYVNEVGNGLVKSTEPQPFIFRFLLVDDPALNAFTIGGGYVYITTGVLGQAGDANEFAGVLAHEIGHVEKRHIARRSEGQGIATLATLASLAAVIAGADPGVLIAAQGLNVSLQLKHSRAFEEEADREGIAIMSESGYDPVGMTHFFQRILAQNPDAGAGIPAYLFTHPAVKERIAATRVEIARTGASKSEPRTSGNAQPSRPQADLGVENAAPPPAGAASARGVSPEAERANRRLAEMQARLAELGARGALEKGLQARATFDAAKTDPLMTQAQEARVEGNDARADALLAQAEALEPGDPRVALARADLAIERGDLSLAQTQLERALALDPNVALVQYQLGSLYARLGDRSRAAFLLEQAVVNFRPNTGARRRAEFELARLEFKMLEASGLAAEAGETSSRVFRRGESVIWWGKVSERFYPLNPAFRVRWRGPSGESVFQENLRMSPGGQVASRLRTSQVAPGAWKVEVSVEATVIETVEFELEAGS
ncbi:MAG: M48 family metalloprotease [Myxococcota bacterium]